MNLAPKQEDSASTPSTPTQAAKHPGAPLRLTLGMITLGWVFGAVWMSATSGAPLTRFASSLHCSGFQFGVLSALPFLASLLSMPASLLIDRTGRRKTIFLWGLYLQRLMWFPIALAPLWLLTHYGPSMAPRAMLVFLGLTLIMHSGAAIGGPAWTSWMADVVPGRIYGKYFSRRRQWGILSAIPAALLVGWILDHHIGGRALTDLHWSAIIFLCAAVFGLADITMFQFVPDVPQAPRVGVKLLRTFLLPLRDRQFLCFAGFVATLTFAVSFMGTFVTLYLLDVVKVNNTGTQLMLLVAPMLAQFLVLPVWGKASDRMGKKPLLAVAALGLVPVGLGWCLVTPDQRWLGYLLAAAGAALWTGVEVANFNLVLEMSASREGQGGGTSFVAINSVIINIAGLLGGLASGVIAQVLRDWHWQPLAGHKVFTFYDVLFALSALLRLVAVAAFLPFLHEPQARPTGETLRFITGNIYNNLFNAILLPVRILQLRRRPPDGDGPPRGGRRRTKLSLADQTAAPDPGEPQDAGISNLGRRQVA